MQDYHFEIGDAGHRCAKGVLAYNAHIVNLSLAVVSSVNTQLLISLTLIEAEDIIIKILIIRPINLLGFMEVDYLMRLAGNERLPSHDMLLIRDDVGKVRDEGWCDCC
jgi:hypothetical protein